MLYKSPRRRHRCHYVSFASKEVEVRKERNKKTPLSIWNPVWNRRIWRKSKAEEDPKLLKSHHHWKTKAYLKTKKKLDKYHLDKLPLFQNKVEIESLKKPETSQEKKNIQNIMYVLFGILIDVWKSKSISCSLEKKKKIEERSSANWWKLDARSETTRGKCKVLGSSFQQTSTVKHVIPYQNRPSPTSLCHSEHFSPFFANLICWENQRLYFFSR